MLSTYWNEGLLATDVGVELEIRTAGNAVTDKECDFPSQPLNHAAANLSL